MSKHFASDEARAITSLELHGLQGWLNAPLTGREVISDQVHISFASKQMEQFEIHPKNDGPYTLAEPPDGPPIGTDEDWDLRP